MKRLEVIPYVFWQHVNGKQASLYGACPWHSESDRANWSKVSNGFTIADNRDGTIGKFNLAGLPRDRETMQRYADLAEVYDYDGIKALRARIEQEIDRLIEEATP